VLNLGGANTTEIDPDAEHAVVIDMPEYNPGMMGSTMRLGKRTTAFTQHSSVLSKYDMKCLCCPYLSDYIRLNYSKDRFLHVTE
jgi:CTP synthase (UTP-ammonia lyase)